VLTDSLFQTAEAAVEQVRWKWAIGVEDELRMIGVVLVCSFQQ